MKQRLDKVLGHLGLGSRRDIDRLARAGLVWIDGELITDSAFKFDPTQARIEVDGEEIIYQEYFHLILHKPAGYITSTRDREGIPITALIAEELQRDDWMPVGRLDKDTEGLLILTTHGELNHRLTHPRFKVDKRYYAELAGPATQADVEAFAEGVELDGERLRPADLMILSDPTKVELVIHEGKYHQVKRMFGARGNAVVYLKRLVFGPQVLPEDLAAGEARPPTAEELRALYGAVGLELVKGS